MKKRFRTRLFAFTLAVIFSAYANMNLSLAQPPTAPLYDLVITNGRVVDGTGNPWFRADVAVKDGRIARIGHINPGEAREVIDAGGKIVAPGFIDVHTHVESIYAQPAAENFVRMA